ncbi:MAG: hypothetical protein A2580_17840 [Hydrogenophilales bacterium RIFOXYD1_FULL_62_11]|nr:MAG: hypothetical protein A2580_17840 [Hydrogenophilales bacterium RIFOXYD1_FULL_62_11]
MNDETSTRILRDQVRELRATISQPHAYGKIIAAAIYLGQQELLTELKSLVPALTAVTVTGESQIGDEGQYFVSIQGYTVHMGEEELHLSDFQIDCGEFADCETLEKLMIASGDEDVLPDDSGDEIELTDELRAKYARLFDRLESLASMDQLDDGDNRFELDPPTSTDDTTVAAAA